MNERNTVFIPYGSLFFSYGTFLFLNEPKFYSHLGKIAHSCILLSLKI